MTNTIDNYMPDHKLLDFIKDKHELRSDVQLAKFLGIGKPSISKIRHKQKKVSANLIIIIYEKTGMSIEQIKGLI